MSNISNKMYKVEINFILRDKHAKYDFHILINKKFLQYTDRNYNSTDQLLNLKNKNINTVYLKEQDYKKYLHNRNKELKRFRNPNSNKNILDNLVQDQKMMKEIFLTSGFEDPKIEMAKTLQENNLKTIKKHRSLFNVLSKHNQLKEKSSELRKLMTTSLCLDMLSKIENSSTFSKEKISMAILLDGIDLNEEEYWQSFEENNTDKKILESPIRTVEYLPENTDFSSPDLLNLILQYHESPDSTGFPYRLHKSRISGYSAIIHVAEYFIGLFIQEGMRYDKGAYVYNKTLEKFNRKNTSYQKALDSLSKIFYKGIIE